MKVEGRRMKRAELGPRDCFSFNGEEFDHCDINEVIEDAWEYADEFEGGKLVQMWAAEPVFYKASDFYFFHEEMMVDAAYDQVDEYALNWNYTPQQVEALELVLKEALDKWADENNAHPTFFTVTNLKEIWVRKPSAEADAEIFEVNPENNDDTE